ncbi:hypothetical protein JCM10212_003061 [Sporobolomyces blumeae]
MAHEISVEGEKVVERDEHGHVVSTKDYANVHRGYLATTHNKRVSDEARENAEQMLHDLEAAHGDAESPSKAKPSSPSHKKQASHETSPSHAKKSSQGHDQAHDEDVHQQRVIAGYKSTLSRHDTSDEAKEHAREKLAELGVEGY